MKFYQFIFVCFSLSCSILTSSEFTLSSYNCGGLTEHYDYLRAAAMQKLMQERYMAEPKNMSLNEEIQRLALKILFAQDSQEKMLAELEWQQKGFQKKIEHLTAVPTLSESPNTIWHQKSEEIITSYKIRPVSISDKRVNRMLKEHVQDLLSDGEKSGEDPLTEIRATMAKRIFAHHLKFDIICLQEANYLDNSMFPDHYEVLFADNSNLRTGIAWNKERFELIGSIGNILDKAFALKLLDKENGRSVLVASAHISGCNPYFTEKNSLTGLADSVKGDDELHFILELLHGLEADIKLIGMDSNVTSLHPRLNILKDAGYKIDYENFLEQTCTNPYQVLNTRIDWIAIDAVNEEPVSIVNIPVLSVGLNHIQTNMSDHKPIAAKISY